MLNTSSETLLEMLEEAELQELTAVWVVMGVFMVSGFVGNVLVVVVYGWRFKPSSTRSFILALAAFDLMITGICMPLEMVSLHHIYTFRWPWLCRFVRYLSASVLSSFTVLAVISVDRCRRIWRLGRQFAVQTVTKIIIAITVAAHIFMIPSLFVNGINTFSVDVNSEDFLIIYRKLQDETTTDTLQLNTDNEFLRNLTGQRCSASDDFYGSTFYNVYIGLILVAGLVDTAVLVAMYGAIGVKAFRVFHRERMTAARTPSSEVSNPAVDLEPNDFSNTEANNAETRSAGPPDVGDVASSLQGNGGRRTSIQRSLSEGRRRPKRKSSACQRKVLSLRPLLLQSEVAESRPWVRDMSCRSRSWPRRKGSETRKFVQDLSRIVQGEAFHDEKGTVEKKHTRSRSLGYIFHSLKLQEPPQMRCKNDEPSTSITTIAEELGRQTPAVPSRCITSQAVCTRSSAKLDTLDPQVYDNQGEDFSERADTQVHELSAKPSCSGADQDQEARRPSSLGQNLHRGHLHRLRYIRRAEGMRTTLMLFLVTLTFILSGFPYMVVKVLELRQTQSLMNLHGSSLVLYQLSLRSYFLQSAANPILYSLCVPHFRQQCHRLFSSLRRS